MTPLHLVRERSDRLPIYGMTHIIDYALSNGGSHFGLRPYLADLGFLENIVIFDQQPLQDDSAHFAYHSNAFDELITNMLLFLPCDAQKRSY